MTSEQAQEFAALHALGALDGADLVAWQNALAEGVPEATATGQARFHDVAAWLARATCPPRPVPPGLKERVLARIRNTPQAPAAQEAPTAATPGFRFVPDGPAGWHALGIPGARCKQLAVNPQAGYAVILMKLPPGGRLPEHAHPGGEEVYVLSGDLQTEGRRLKAGDFLHADAGTHHRALYTEHGCTALLVTPLAPTHA